jgi:hypothetical protein
VAGEVEKALKGPGGPLQSHRALPCNNDDWLRMAAVPVGVKDASFRHMKGVHTWDDGGWGWLELLDVKQPAVTCCLCPASYQYLLIISTIISSCDQPGACTW